MKQPAKIMGIALILLCSVSSLVVSFYVIPFEFQQWSARRGLNAIASTKLPTLETHKKIDTISFDSSQSAFGNVCYYATDYLVIGSSLPELEAIDTYVENLQSLGWEPKWRDPFPKSLFYDENTYLNISSGVPSPVIKNDVDYSTIREIFKTVVYVKLTYVLPNRGICY